MWVNHAAENNFANQERLEPEFAASVTLFAYLVIFGRHQCLRQNVKGDKQSLETVIGNLRLFHN